MSSIGTGYDLSASTYSPDGRVFQIEYAGKAVENSGTAIGIRCKDGVVFAVERLITSKLHEAESNKRTFTVGRHIGIVCAGLIADSRKIVSESRDEAAEFRIVMDQAIPLKHLVDRVSGYVHAHTLYGGLRPFGCNIIFGSCGPEGPLLYMMDPSGVAWGYFGCAMGKAKQAAKTEIEKLKTQELTCLEGLKEAAKIIYTVHDEVKDKAFELEMSWVTEGTNGLHQSIPEELFQEAVQYAKDAIKESDSEDES